MQAPSASAADQGAFRQLMRRHNRLLYRAARSILKDDAEAEDALQEAITHYGEDLEAAEGTMNQSSPEQPEHAAARAQTRRLLEAKIDQLPEAFRTVFVLRALEELSVEETAAALDIPEATVRTRFFRARSQLREALSREVDLAFDDAFAFDGARCDRIVAAVMAILSRSFL
jgi:RNA polymerase sigma-70 factor, ECF subfamily